MPEVDVKDLLVSFRVYHDRLPSFKDYVLGFLSRKRNGPAYSDYRALDKVTLKIGQGEKVGIIGPNGAGKSTLLKTICRIYEPEAGAVLTNGVIAPLLEIGAGFHPEYTGRENIHLNSALLGYSAKEITDFENRVIDFAELHDFIDTPVKYYSTGMYLRLGFSVATAVTPDILIMDEMFAGGDKSFLQKASTKMHELIDTASIMILVSHDLSIIEQFCNRVIWLEKGAVKADDETSTVLKLYRQ